MAYDLKTASEDTTLDANTFIFGADSQSASDPSVYKVSTLKTHIIGSGSVSVASGKTLTASNTLTLAGTDSTTMTFPSTSGTVATLNTAQTFTQPQTISDSTSRTTSSPVIDAAQTWNASGTTFTGLKLNVTDTSSASGSLLMDLQVGGNSLFSVRKDGALLLTDQNTRIVRVNSSTIDVYANNVLNFRFQGTFFAATVLGVGSVNPDIFLTRRNAANLRIGNTDAASPVAQTLSVQSVSAGTSNTAGANLTITGSQGTGNAAGGSIIFQVAPAGSSGTAQNALSEALRINSAGLVSFAGTTSSFPALKRSSASLQVRLADDSANAALESASVKTDAPNGGTSATWKLGTVATVSPTSPNRTIEVDIGGTIYYISAKTTND